MLAPDISHMKKLIFISGMVTCIPSAHALDLGLAIDAGTTGIGLHVIFPVIDNKFNIRAGANHYSKSSDFEAGGVPYHARERLKTMDVLLDYYPFGSTFRVTAGGFLNLSRTDLHFIASQDSYEYNGVTYSKSDVGGVDGTIAFQRYVPYLGIGWDKAASAEKGFSFTSDIGVMFLGSPRVSQYTSGCKLSAAVCTYLDQELMANTGSLYDKAKEYSYYLVARFGIVYKF